MARKYRTAACIILLGANARSTSRQAGTANSGGKPPHSTGSLIRVSGGEYTRAKFMADWPHSPSHRVTERGTYIVTAATYGKQPLFASKSRLNLLCETLIKLCYDGGWNLQAWSVFPNHYHFVAESASPANLSSTIGRLTFANRSLGERQRSQNRTQGLVPILGHAADK